MLISAPRAVADDIEIYTQSSPAGEGLPLVVLALDLNLDPTEIVCSNVLADPSTLVGEPLCETLQQVAVLPVLEQSLGLEIGSLLDTLLGDSAVVGGLLGLVGDLSGISLENLANTLRGITGDSGSGTDVALDQLDVVRLLLYRVLHQLVGVRLAIIANNANTCAADEFTNPRHNTKNCSNGAFFMLGATELLEDTLDQTVDDVLARIGQLEVDTLDPGADPTHPFQGKEVYYELVRYLTDGRIYNATINHDNGLPLTPDPEVAPGNSGVDYISPLDDGTCEDIYVVNVMFTDSKQDSDSDADILADPIFASANADGGEFTWQEMIAHLADDGFTYDGGEYRIRSHFLVNGPGGGVGSLLSNLVGTTMNLPIGINPLATNFAARETFSPVAATSASLGGPQTAFSRTDLSRPLNDLYIGLFKPDPDRKPAWRGNLKKLKLAGEGENIAVVDALNQLAIAPDGNISEQALTFWTDTTGLSNPPAAVQGRDGRTPDRGGAGMFLSPPYSIASPSNPPGGIGTSNLGAAMYYERAGNSESDLSVGALELNSDTVSEAQPALEVPDRLQAAEMIAWARGYETDPNVLGDEDYGGFLGFLDSLVSGLTGLIENLLEDILSGLFCNDILGLFGIILGQDCDVPASEEPPAQPWLMGDILHSHPLAIDYGRTTGTGGQATVESDIRIFTGTNRGFLHQFRNEPDPGDGSTPVWQFAPRATLKNFRLWQSGTPTASSRPYGVDGAPVALIEDNDGVIKAADGDRVYLYFGLRRGGKGYYALDVTNPDVAPTGLWRIRKTTGTNSDFAELGLTFSTPRIGQIRIEDDNQDLETRDVLVFGGGYDGGYTSAGNALGKDAARGSEGTVGSNDDEGNALFVVDAETGELIWKARHGGINQATTSNGKPVWEHTDLDDSIPSQVTSLDTNGDGFLDRIYVGDTGGRVWRADIGVNNPADWRMAPIANLGRHAAGNNPGVADDRRFFHRPDAVRVSHGEQGFLAIIIGSGNRADPLNRDTDNYLYVIKDTGVLNLEAAPISHADLQDFSENCAGASCYSLLESGQAAFGWKIALGPEGSGRGGEKLLSSPTTIAGQILLTTYVPPSASVNACTPQEGGGRLYAIDLLTARGVLDLFGSDAEGGTTGSVDDARATPMASTGIPAGVSYIRPQKLLGSDYGITDIDHRVTWRTYWRERVRDY